MTEAPFAHRGVVEGFYGPPFSHADRLWLLSRIGSWGMNRYVYAPKDDPLAREQWRTPYPAETLDAFEALIEHGRRCGVAVGCALSPGLSIEYASTADVATLQRKFGAFVDRGARVFCLALDDVPTHLVHAADRERYASLAEAHVALANHVRDELPDDAWLWLVPTDYAGVGASDYLTTLGTALHPDISLGWTGRTVVSPTIESHEARERATSAGRRLVVWDNYPVADGPMRPMLHLGPYAGRAPDLSDSVSGILLNPMQHARASAVGLRTAAEYLASPERYDPEAAWGRALEEIGAGAPRAFACFAEAHRFSALQTDVRDAALEAAIATLHNEWPEGSSAGAALNTLESRLTEREDANERLRSALQDAELAREIAPWLDAHREETRRMRIAADLLAALCTSGHALEIAIAFFRFEGRLTRIQTPQHASYGPRRVVYPQLISMDDDDAGFGSDPVLFLDRCLADELVRFAEARALERLTREGGRTSATRAG